MRTAILALALFLTGGAGYGQTPYPLIQYLNIRGAGAPTLAPDGGRVAFSMRPTGTSQVWVVPAQSGWPNQVTFFGSSVGEFEWSPRGDWILVSADTDGDEQFQLYLVKPDGTQKVALTSDPKVRHEFGGWSRDGRTIFYASNKRNPRYFDCYLMDVDSRRESLVFQKDAVLGASALSPDNRWLAAVEYTSNVDSNVYLVDTRTGQARNLTEHSGDVFTGPIGFSADGRELYVSSDRGREFQNLAAISIDTGELRFLQDEKADVSTAELSLDAKRLAFTMNRDGYEELSVWEMPSRKAVKLPSIPRGLVSSFDFSADGKRLAIAASTPVMVSDVWLVDLARTRLTRVTYGTYAGIDPESFSEPYLVRYRTFDGKEIPAFLALPKNAPQNRSVPVILSVHGGPESQEKAYFSPLYQYFLNRGYAVLAPNIRGSTGYGKTFVNLDNADKRWDALKDLAAAVEFVKGHPSLDPRKVAIIGGSYGGFAVLAMLAHYPDLFAAGVDMFGIADFRTFLQNTAPFRRPLRMAEYGDPEKHGDFMDAISPLRNAHKIKAPLMIIQGANDPRVPESESRQIAEKVRGTGGIAEYLLFPDEGHGISKLPNRIKAYEAMVAFLDRYVKK